MSNYRNSVVGKHFNDLLDVDWEGIPRSSLVLKCKFYEDGYILLVSSFVAVYGEMLNEKAIQDRFKILNPYAEMLPRVILKHVKESIKKILCCAALHEGGGSHCKMTLVGGTLTIWHEIVAGDMHFLFNYEPRRLPDIECFNHLVKPTLIRGLVLDEEKTALKKKVDEMEGKNNSFSSAQRKNSRGFLSEIKEVHEPTRTFMEAFLYFQNGKSFLPENVSPPKGVHSSCTRASLVTPNIATGSIQFVEDDSEMNIGSQNESKEDTSCEKNDRINPENNGFSLSMDDILNNLEKEKAEENNMSPDAIKRKCYKFFNQLIRYACLGARNRDFNFKNLIQNLIDGCIEPEEFTTQLQKELQSEHQPYLLPFLKRSVPLLQEAINSGEMTLTGIRPPPFTPSLQVPNTQKSVPHVPQALNSGEVTIKGTRPPPLTPSLQSVVPNTQKSVPLVPQALISREMTIKGTHPPLMNASLQSLVPTTQKSVPHVPQALISGEMNIKGTHSPLMTASLQSVVPTTQKSVSCVPPALISGEMTIEGICPPLMTVPLRSLVLTAETFSETVKRRGQSFFTEIIRLAGEISTMAASNVKYLIQNLIDGAIEPEVFFRILEKELHSKIEPSLIQFFKNILPLVQQALISGEMTIEGIRPPPVNVSLQSPVPTTLKEDNTSNSTPCLEPSPAKKIKEEDDTSNSTPCFEPSPAKKKKVIKF